MHRFTYCFTNLLTYMIVIPKKDTRTRIHPTGDTHMQQEALDLQRMLEAEGATFHTSLIATPLPAMGGGMGVIVSERVPAGTPLAVLPYQSMITVRKARFNIALAELALQWRDELDNNSEGVAVDDDIIPFTAHIWSKGEQEAYCAAQDRRMGAGGTSRFGAALDQKIKDLTARLSPTDTMVCYILLMASLYGELHKACEGGAAMECSSSTTNANKAQRTTSTLRFTHENKWMRLWLHALPPMYDNLLELACCADAGVASPRSYQRAAAYTTTDADIKDVCIFSRQRAKILDEQRGLTQRYEHCCKSLLFLTQLPIGDCVDKGEGDTVSQSPITDMPAGCTTGQFLWAFNTLMSRGFAFVDDVWAMMPYVDYFNYALESNGSMSERSLEPSGRSKGGIITRRQRDPSAYVYEFSLVQTVPMGEQVFLSYGSYSDFELLMWYGFTLRPFLLPLSAVPNKALPLRLLPAPLGEDAALREALPLISEPSSRARLHDALHRESIACEEVMAQHYELWCGALQRAFSHVFSPLANTDGEYPTHRPGDSWLDRLFSVSPTPHQHWEGAQQPEVDVFAGLLVKAWQGRVCTYTGTTTSCALGALGTSHEMGALIRSIGQQCVAKDAECAQFAAARQSVVALWVLRAIAWLELVSSSWEPSPTTATAAFMSPSAASMLTVASRDAWHLLYYIAVDATDEQLRAYLKRRDY